MIGDHDMRKSDYTSWIGIGMETMRLSVAASEVMMLRSAKIAKGDAAAAREAHLMVDEKITALTQWNMALFTGTAGNTPRSSARKALSHYGRKVRANRRRLNKSL
jgi:hypothetical protein